MKDIMKIYLDAAIESFYKFYGYAAITDEQRHVVQIGSSIMMHRDGILNGGGFVTAFVNNDLMQAIGRADKTVINHFPFFANIKQYGRIND
jgi:hypothetical protein